MFSTAAVPAETASFTPIPTLAAKMAGLQSSSLLIDGVSVGMRAQATPAQEIEPAVLLRTGVARRHQSSSPSKLAGLFLNNTRYFSGPLGLLRPVDLKSLYCIVSPGQCS